MPARPRDRRSDRGKGAVQVPPAQLFSRAATAPILTGTPKVACAWQAGDTDAAGPFEGESEGTCPGGRIKIFPEPGFMPIRIPEGIRQPCGAALASGPQKACGCDASKTEHPANRFANLYVTRQAVLPRSGRFWPYWRFFLLASAMTAVPNDRFEALGKAGFGWSG